MSGFYDDIDSEAAFFLLDGHLQAVERYEDQEKEEKIVKHLKTLEKLLDKQQDGEKTSDEVFGHLQDQTDLLIKQWNEGMYWKGVFPFPQWRIKLKKGEIEC